MSITPWVDGLTIGQVLSQTIKDNPQREAIVFCQPGVRRSWHEFGADVEEVARSLLALGFRRGDHLGVWSTNWPEWVTLQFATAQIGVVLVTINPAYRPAELAYALAQSRVRGLALVDRFKSSDYDAIFAQICPEMEQMRHGALSSQRFPDLRWVIRLRGAPHPCLMAWDEFRRAGDTLSSVDWQLATGGLRPGDPINLQYTSGTTGNPKGALLTHRNILLNAFYAGECQRLTEADRVCIPVPLYHCFGCVLGTLCAMIRGATMVFPHETFAADATLDAVASERCTAIYGVPTMFIAQFERFDQAPRDLTSLRTGIMAGSPCPIELMRRVTHEMGAREITIAYGQTEASPLITMTRTDDPLEHRVGTVGRPIPGVETKIVAENGADVPVGVSGELCTRGHNVMLGYYDQPELTRQVIDADGWLHTGDIALCQPDGFLRITGRLKDLIIRGGENISPREIEELLYQHPSVEEVQVIGVPDGRFGEEVLACVRVRANGSLTENEVREYCRAHLAYFKVPRYVWFMDQFPTTATGKVQKFRLRELAIDRFQLQDAANIETA